MRAQAGCSRTLSCASQLPILSVLQGLHLRIGEMESVQKLPARRFNILPSLFINPSLPRGLPGDVACLMVAFIS
jgi:hypothetical protein